MGRALTTVRKRRGRQHLRLPLAPALLVAVAVLMLVPASMVSPSGFPAPESSLRLVADDTSGEAVRSTATLQDAAPSSSDLVVRYGGRTFTALPSRLRIDQQASPQTYSLDFRRVAQYGDEWTAISVFPFGPDKKYYDNITGVRRVSAATAIARGTLSSNDADQIFPVTPLDYAARQVAIWNVTNGLPINATTVPYAPLRSMATTLVNFAVGEPQVPTQLAQHGVEIFIREVTGNTVTFGVLLQLEPNRFVNTAQLVDLTLDGQTFQVKTGEGSRVEQRGKLFEVASTTPLALSPKSSEQPSQVEPGAAETPQAVPGSTPTSASPSTVTDPDPDPDQLGRGASYNLASVTIDRNTAALDISASWTTTSAPGFVFAASGSSPPLMTADQTILSFSGSTQLNPDDYGGPADILDRAGTRLLSDLPTWQLWVVLLVGLYVISRLGGVADWILKPVINRIRGAAVAAWRRMRKAPSEQAPEPAVVSSVRMEAPTLAQAMAAALELIGPGHGVSMKVVRRERSRLLRPDETAVVEATVVPLGAGVA